MNRKEFENYQDSRLDRSEVQEAYNNYVTQYKKEQEYEFYREHRTDPWFIEKYDPSEQYKWKVMQQSMCQYLSVEYSKCVIDHIEDYKSIRFEQDPNFDYNQLVNELGVQIHKSPLFAFDTDTLTLYLKYIPMPIKRYDLVTALKDNLEGFVHLSMSEPMRNHGFNRLAWVNFSNEHDYE